MCFRHFCFDINDGLDLHSRAAKVTNIIHTTHEATQQNRNTGTNSGKRRVRIEQELKQERNRSRRGYTKKAGEHNRGTRSSSPSTTAEADWREVQGGRAKNRRKHRTMEVMQNSKGGSDGLKQREGKS